MGVQRIWAVWIGLAVSTASCTQILLEGRDYSPSSSGEPTAPGAGGSTSSAGTGGGGEGASLVMSASASTGTELPSCPSGTTSCGTDCVNILNDPKNCGGCGHDCEGQACEAAVCSPVTLAAQQQGPVRLAVDATNVYWTNSDEGSVRKVQIAGGAVQTIATAQAWPSGIAVDKQFVYWANNGDSQSKGQVCKAPLSGGPPVTIVSGESGPDTLVVTDTSVVWANYGYFSNDPSVVKKSPLAAGSASTEISSYTFAWSVALGASGVYGVSSDGLLQRFPLDGAPVPLTNAAQDGSDLAVGKDAVYYTAINSGKIRKVPLGGGDPVVLYNGGASGATSTWGIAVDDAYVYWTDDVRGLVMRVKLAGGPAETIASGQSEPNGIALDDTHVYWVNYKGGTVMKLHK